MCCGHNRISHLEFVLQKTEMLLYRSCLLGIHPLGKPCKYDHFTTTLQIIDSRAVCFAKLEVLCVFITE